MLTDDDVCSDKRYPLEAAWRRLENSMALVPAGDTRLVSVTPQMNDSEFECEAEAGEHVFVEPLYIDRYAVTNAEFAEFVAVGSYKEVDLWPADILPLVLQFTDSSGQSGPRYWTNGKPPKKKLDHPVVGISWIEANAYATWVGKRLPTSAEWQRAGTWPTSNNGSGYVQRYPWGNAFDTRLANTWSAGRGGTVPVQEYLQGSTPNGIQQLVGNVWEWTASPFECISADANLNIVFDQPMADIRGGAFDTYFESQATCQFRSAKPVLYRGANVGFRCCVSVNNLRRPLDPLELLDSWDVD